MVHENILDIDLLDEDIKMSAVKFKEEKQKKIKGKCILINNIIENYFIFVRKNKDKIIENLQIKASLSKDDAENVYDISMKVIAGKIKNKIKHPFKS